MKLEKKRNRAGYLYILPWIIGFVFLQFYPFLVSFWYSLTNMSMLKKATFIGLDNYVEIFTHYSDFRKSLSVTFIYVFTAVPLKLAFALFIAMLLNMKVKDFKTPASLVWQLNNQAIILSSSSEN